MMPCSREVGTVAWGQSIAFVFRVEEIYVGISEEFVGFYQFTRYHTPKVRNILNLTLKLV